MKKTVALSYFVLLLFTLIVALVASGGVTPLAVKVIILLSLTKFLIVGYKFMELKNAHTFWKTLLVVFAALMGTVLVLVLG